MADVLDVHDLPEEDVKFLTGIITYLRQKQKADYKNKRNIMPSKVNVEDFSFKKARKALTNYKGSLSDALIEERRSYV